MDNVPHAKLAIKTANSGSIFSLISVAPMKKAGSTAVQSRQ